jgi:hypothetical protein
VHELLAMGSLPFFLGGVVRDDVALASLSVTDEDFLHAQGLVDLGGSGRPEPARRS